MEEPKEADQNHWHNSIQGSHSSSKNLLVLLNPRSGTGSGMKVFKRQVLPYLTSREINYELHVTQLEPNVRTFFKDLPLDELKKFYAVLVVSGDGTIHQLLNGLMSRPDADETMNIPLSIYPCGTGNGLAHSLHYLTPTPDTVHNSHQTIITSCDLVKITYGLNKTIWSFLSVGWGLIADIDIESEEKLRLLGDQRFQIYSIYKAIRRKFYKGRLSYQRISETEPLRDTSSSTSTSSSDVTTSTSNQEQTSKSVPDKWIHHEGEFACIYAVYLPYISKSVKISPKSTLTDQLIYLLYVTEHLSFWQVIRLLDSITRGLQDKLLFAHVVPVKKFQFQPLEPSRVVVDGEVIPWVLDDGPICAEVASNTMKLTSIIPIQQ